MRACVPLTVLGTGHLFPLIDDDAELAVTMANRALTEAEWEQYCASPASSRKRRPLTLKQRAELEAEAGRVSDETLLELARHGQTLVTIDEVTEGAIQRENIRQALRLMRGGAR